LAEIMNPRPVFINPKQVNHSSGPQQVNNSGGPQQVNNGSALAHTSSDSESGEPTKPALQGPDDA
jgi:hypothetical protein